MSLQAGGVQTIDICPALLASVRDARARYGKYMDNEKKKKKREDAVTEMKKRKAEELTSMRDKRRRLEADCHSLESDADKFADQAENTSKLTLLAKSNALHRSAKLKRSEMLKLDAVIAVHTTNCTSADL